jgi:hypothetical protein
MPKYTVLIYPEYEDTEFDEFELDQNTTPRKLFEKLGLHTHADDENIILYWNYDDNGNTCKGRIINFDSPITIPTFHDKGINEHFKIGCFDKSECVHTVKIHTKSWKTLVETEKTDQAKSMVIIIHPDIQSTEQLHQYIAEQIGLNLSDIEHVSNEYGIINITKPMIFIYDEGFDDIGEHLFVKINNKEYIKNHIISYNTMLINNMREKIQNLQKEILMRQTDIYNAQYDI